MITKMRVAAGAVGNLTAGDLVTLNPNGEVVPTSGHGPVIGFLIDHPNADGAVGVSMGEDRYVGFQRIPKDMIRRQLLEHAGPEVREFEDAVDAAWRLANGDD